MCWSQASDSWSTLSLYSQKGPHPLSLSLPGLSLDIKTRLRNKLGEKVGQGRGMANNDSHLKHISGVSNSFSPGATSAFKGPNVI